MTECLTGKQIADLIIDWTCKNSNHQESRDYFGLSHASYTVDELVQMYQNGFLADVNAQLKYYKGYQMEADLLRRLIIVFGDRVQSGGEISAFGGLVKGHPDFRFDGAPGESKSVPLDGHLPQPGRLPRRAFWQMQAYMFYARSDRGLIVYESRASGLIAAFWVQPVGRIQEEIDAKYRTAVERMHA